jgi:hypothetical protein
MTKPTTTKRIDRLHSQNPTDAAWRARQAQVDADIEGLHRDAGIDQFVANMEAEGVAPREKVQSLSETLVRCASQASLANMHEAKERGVFLTFDVYAVRNKFLQTGYCAGRP